MNIYETNTINGLRTLPGLEKGMHLYVFIDGILEEPKNCSNEITKRTNRQGYEDQTLVRLIEISLVHGRAILTELVFNDCK